MVTGLRFGGGGLDGLPAACFPGGRQPAGKEHMAEDDQDEFENPFPGFGVSCQFEHVSPGRSRVHLTFEPTCGRNTFDLTIPVRWNLGWETQDAVAEGYRIAASYLEEIRKTLSAAATRGDVVWTDYDDPIVRQ